MARTLYDTKHDVSTAEAGHVATLAERIAELGALTNEHATALDANDLTIGGTLTADAQGRAKIAAGFFNEATATSAFAALAVDATLLKQKAQIPGTPTIAVGAEAAHARLATITLKDLAGVALGAIGKATVWISDAAGGAPSGVAPSGATVITTGVTLKAVTANVLYELVSTAAGVIAVTVTEATAKTFYINVAIGDVIASAALVFAG